VLAVDGGRIWYKVSGTGPGIPVILLHGGPGFASFYLKPFEDLGDDRQVVRYDQLGGGRSDRTTDTTLFTIDHFVRELESLRASLGCGQVHLLGHSWGTILAVEYYRAHPEHVASLILASPALDIPAWERNAQRLVSTLSDSAQQAIRDAEATGRYDAPAYQAAMGEFYGKYVWRHPVEADLDSTMATVNEAIYNYMQGPSEFTITGTLKSYDVTADLSSIGVPTLYTVGEFDEADTATVRHLADLTPGAETAVTACAGGGPFSR
jgi:proline iminopeptidase